MPAAIFTAPPLFAVLKKCQRKWPKSSQFNESTRERKVFKLPLHSGKKTPHSESLRYYPASKKTRKLVRMHKTPTEFHCLYHHRPILVHTVSRNKNFLISLDVLQQFLAVFITSRWPYTTRQTISRPEKERNSQPSMFLLTSFRPAAHKKTAEKNQQQTVIFLIHSLNHVHRTAHSSGQPSTLLLLS